MSEAMEPILPALVSIGLIIAGLFFTYAFRASRAPTVEEKGLTPIYVEQAGGRFDSWNWTVPFVRVAVYPRMVVISSATHRFILREDDLRGIEVERHLFSTGVRIRHGRPDVPEVIIWSRNIERLKNALEMCLAWQQS
jgi:hypothetical protein